MSGDGWSRFAALIAARDPQCRGAVILGLNQPIEALVEGFAQATHPIVKGFMVGRTIWGDASRAGWPARCEPISRADRTLVARHTSAHARRSAWAPRQACDA